MVEFFRKSINFEWASKWENILVFLVKIIVIKQVVQNADVIIGYIYSGFQYINNAAVGTNVDFLPFGTPETYVWTDEDGVFTKMIKKGWWDFWYDLGAGQYRDTYTYEISQEAVRMFYPNAVFNGTNLNDNPLPNPTTAANFMPTMEIVLLQPYFLLIKAIAYLVFVISIGRVFELSVYTIFAPLPLATFASDTTHDVAKNFIKNYIATVLQIAVIVIMFIVYVALGKASVQHGANVEHNNREFIAGNIDKKRINENITYVREDVQQAYQELFGKAVAEYNQKQKQPCRRIQDYYQHISNSKREEAFYEIVVQFGDSKTTPCDSENGKAAKEMLDEYIRSFKQRNPNLHIFNAVLHMDEASPHLHIDFIPFYEKGRKNGLNKGVSMKSALIEQGFNPKSIKHNQLVSWEASERDIMESILHQHGYTRDDKNAKYAHQTVDEYKKSQDEKKIVAALRSMKNISPESLSENSVQQLRAKLNHLENENRMLEKKQRSPYKSFYYSSPDKQAFVQEQLDLLDIPYRETENGFEAGECFVDEIRKIEKNYRQPKSTAREKLRDDIDRLIMQAASIFTIAEKVMGGTYVQSLVGEERERRESKFIPNGLKSAT